MMRSSKRRLGDSAAVPVEGTGPTLGDLVKAHGGLVLEHGAAGQAEHSVADEDRSVPLDDPRLALRPGDLHVHSGSVAPGDLFAALPGLKVDGVRFVPDAVQRGASLVLMPSSRSAKAVRERIAQTPPSIIREPMESWQSPLLWVHPHPKRILGALAADVHGRPADSLALAAVTGTNGKTSVVHLAYQLLNASGRSPAMLGTAGHTLRGPHGPLLLEASHTTPDATGLQRLFARHLRGGGDSAVMEASSHALVQGRLGDLQLRAAAFTNLTRDHLDYHRTMERYAEAKARLWDSVEPGGSAVVFGQSDVSNDMARRAEERNLKVVRVAVENEGDLVARGVRMGERGAHFELSGLGFTGEEVALPLRGIHNVENALVALALAHSLGSSVPDLQRGLGELSAAPGRLEAVPLPRRIEQSSGRFEVLVDYAHTPDALERVLGALRSDMQARAEASGEDRGRLICVFGCGGDRDRGKRVPMGRAAGALSDVSIVTSDNPRSEDPQAIVEAVAEGIDEVGGRRILEVDRSAAIERALQIAQPSDVVLIAGKGHENTQVVNGRSLPFDDRVVAAEAFERMASGQS
jgi:UDP-N-acetylmuramyl-tripeptide synthetase